MKTKRAILVYQAGIANVFQVAKFNLARSDQRKAKRLVQGDFRACEWFARGLRCAGASVAVAACNMAGDITDMIWTGDLENQPFSESFRKL